MALAQHTEHRLPIPKLVLIASDALFNGDFRGAVFVNWLLLVAIVLILLAALRRSTPSVPPFSALLISSIALGASNNALRWGVENQFVLSAALMTAASCSVLFAPTAGTIIVAGLSATLLPLTGGNGVLFSVGALAALMFCALRAPRALKILALVFMILSIAVSAFYFRGYVSPANHEGLRTQSLLAIIAMCGISIGWFEVAHSRGPRMRHPWNGPGHRRDRHRARGARLAGWLGNALRSIGNTVLGNTRSRSARGSRNRALDRRHSSRLRIIRSHLSLGTASAVRASRRQIPACMVRRRAPGRSRPTIHRLILLY